MKENIEKLKQSLEEILISFREYPGKEAAIIESIINELNNILIEGD